MSIEVGQHWKDNDPRMHRTLVVDRVDDRYVYLHDRIYPKFRTRIMRKFFKPAGKTYRTGFSQVLEESCRKN